MYRMMDLLGASLNARRHKSVTGVQISRMHTVFAPGAQSGNGKASRKAAAARIWQRG
jgi:hypothetical protein